MGVASTTGRMSVRCDLAFGERAARGGRWRAAARARRRSPLAAAVAGTCCGNSATRARAKQRTPAAARARNITAEKARLTHHTSDSNPVLFPNAGI